MAEEEDKHYDGRRLKNLLDDMQSTQLHLMLGEMRGDIKNLINLMASFKEDHNQLRDDVEHRMNLQSGRISKLEEFRWKLAGLAVIVPLFLTIAGLFLPYIF
tara:strand:+ start:30800 stop:31105 length:306 start_codon:yes stop_codon:yes gene_type:complete